jgi:hypothetical protein
MLASLVMKTSVGLGGSLRNPKTMMDVTWVASPRRTQLATPANAPNTRRRNKPNRDETVSFLMTTFTLGLRNSSEMPARRDTSVEEGH